MIMMIEVETTLVLNTNTNTWCEDCGGLPINWEMMSIGMGKMMVLLFSAEMLFNV